MLKIIFFLSIGLRFAVGQFAECGSNCRLMTDCPEMQRFAQSSNPEDILKVRKAICGFENRVAKVCCPEKKVVPDVNIPKVVPSKVSPLSRPNLLPFRCGNPTTDDKIFGGSPAPLGAYPWMAAFGYIEQSGPQAKGGIKFDCAGALITERYVLTAAHCLDPKSLGRRILSVIHLGDWNLGTPEDCQVTLRGSKCAPPHIVAGIEEVTTHPKFNSRAETSDDVALIRLNVSIDFETTKAYIQPLCLPPRGLNPRIVAKGRDPLAAGWGFTEFGNSSNILLRVNVPFADNKLCKQIYGARFLENEQLCVGGIADQDTCSGDSGGPLILSGPQGPPYLQIGIVAYGAIPCALDNVPAVYTSVSAYRDWILENLKP